MSVGVGTSCCNFAHVRALYPLHRALDKNMQSNQALRRQEAAMTKTRDSVSISTFVLTLQEGNVTSNSNSAVLLIKEVGAREKSVLLPRTVLRQAGSLAHV